MEILVIGGSGFLGSHVCDRLTDAGHQVTIYDKNASRWLAENQKFIAGDILDSDHLDSVIQDKDVVYNFAALADLNQALRQPTETVKINILGNVFILEACRKYEIKRYMHASTIYVQSREGGFYRCSKFAAELYVEEYQKAYGLDYTIMRYGSLYGPRSDSSNGLYRIVSQAIKTNKISYAGSPETLREYIHVVDAAIASVNALSEEFKNQSVVFTGQEPMKVIEMLYMLAEILGIKGEIHFENEKQLGHYVRTPYSYQSRIGRKFIPPFHFDLGQGLLQLIEEIKGESY